MDGVLEPASRTRRAAGQCARANHAGKAPLTADGLHDAATDPVQVREWWARWPDANVGLRTGVAFDVLDVDGDEGFDELARLFGGDDAVLPPGPVATPAGVHLSSAPTGRRQPRSVPARSRLAR